MFKHKACINVHGLKQEYASNLLETFSYIVTCFTIRMVLVLCTINGWSTHQLDFVLNITQDNIEFNMHMEIPQGIKTKGGISISQFLKLLKSINGQRKGYRVWNQNLNKGIEEIGFRQYSMDK